MVRAVVFDLDYTLAVPERDRETILREATDAAGAPAIDREAYLAAHRESHAHRTREPIFARLLDGADAEPAAVARAYRERISESLVPVPGAAALVDELRRERRVGLLTNGPVVAQRDKLRALGWEELFDAAVVTGDLGVGKPDPRTFRAAVDALDVPAADAVYVGDELDADIRGAADAGLLAVQVLFDGGPEPDGRADAHVDRDRLREDLPGVVAAL